MYKSLVESSVSDNMDCNEIKKIDQNHKMSHKSYTKYLASITYIYIEQLIP